MKNKIALIITRSLVIERNLQSKPIFFKIFFLLNLLAPTEVTFLRTFVEAVGFFGN